MPQGPMDLKKHMSMLDQLADMYPEVADTVEQLQGELSDITPGMDQSEEEPMMPMNEDELPSMEDDMGGEDDPFPAYK